jgi:hypothetical protein
MGCATSDALTEQSASAYARPPSESWPVFSRVQTAEQDNKRVEIFARRDGR